MRWTNNLICCRSGVGSPHSKSIRNLKNKKKEEDIKQDKSSKGHIYKDDKNGKGKDDIYQKLDEMAEVLIQIKMRIKYLKN